MSLLIYFPPIYIPCREKIFKKHGLQPKNEEESIDNPAFKGERKANAEYEKNRLYADEIQRIFVAVVVVM